MASLEQHKLDTLKILGAEFEDVHRWLDGMFAILGPVHRRARHHAEGVKEAGLQFGKRAETAALVHILRDCRHLPTKADYEAGFVDAVGLKKHWSTAAYIRYGDIEFEELVSEQLRPSGLILWAFLDWPDVQTFLGSISQYDEETIAALEARWTEARSRLRSADLDGYSGSFTPAAEMKDSPSEVLEYLQSTLAKISENSGAPEENITIGYVDISALTNAFVYIDYEFLEDLKPELAGTSALDIAKFALPQSVQSPIKAVGDLTQRSITFVSRQKTMKVSNVRVAATPFGTEVSYLISTNTAGVLISDVGNHLLLRNGIHRAYLLAQLGVRQIPCVYVQDKNVVPFVGTAYPTFSPPVLMQTRPPLLTDFLRPELCLQAPMQRSHKIIRISADETMIPVD